MRNRFYRPLLAGVVSSLLVLGMALPAFAETDPKDQWGEIPDDYVLIVPSSGSTVYVGADTAPQNGNSDQSVSSDTGKTIITVEGEIIPYEDQFTSDYIISTDGSVSRFNPQTVADEIYRLSNIERTNVGLEEVERRTDLDKLAVLRAKELAVSFGHTRPDGTNYTSLADEYGISYRYIGENAGALGNGTATTMINNWLHSEGHCRNMLNSKHTGLGVGVYKEGQKVYFIQMFIYE